MMRIVFKGLIGSVDSVEPPTLPSALHIGASSLNRSSISISGRYSGRCGIKGFGIDRGLVFPILGPVATGILMLGVLGKPLSGQKTLNEGSTVLGGECELSTLAWGIGVRNSGG